MTDQEFRELRSMIERRARLDVSRRRGGSHTLRRNDLMEKPTVEFSRRERTDHAILRYFERPKSDLSGAARF